MFGAKWESELRLLFRQNICLKALVSYSASSVLSRVVIVHVLFD